jgi:hypothetical protein
MYRSTQKKIEKSRKEAEFSKFFSWKIQGFFKANFQHFLAFLLLRKFGYFNTFRKFLKINSKQKNCHHINLCAVEFEIFYQIDNLCVFKILLVWCRHLYPTFVGFWVGMGRNYPYPYSYSNTQNSWVTHTHTHTQKPKILGYLTQFCTQIPTF